MASQSSDGFISFEEEDSDGEQPLPKKARSTASAQPLAVDLAVSDLLLQVEESSDACGGVTVRAGGGNLEGLLPPEVWAFGRGQRAAFQGTSHWRLRVRHLQRRLDGAPVLLFGVMAQPPGCAAMPETIGGQDGNEQQPALALAADTGIQLFSSNMSPKLLHAPLLPRPLEQGDVVEIRSDFSRGSLSFRVEGEDERYEARRMPGSSSGRCSSSSQRLQDTAYFAFFALRAGTCVELEDIEAPSRTSLPVNAEAIILCGPPGAGKTSWARRTAQQAPNSLLQILGAEWLEHRANFAMLAQSSHKINGMNVECNIKRDTANNDILDPAAATAAAAGAAESSRPAKNDELQHIFVAQKETDAEATQPRADLGVKGRLDAALRLIAAFGESSTVMASPCGATALTPAEEPNASSDVTAGLPWTLARAWELLPTVLPELLLRASARGTSVVADDCHLQAKERARLRAALLRYPGSVRWVVVLPKTMQELQRRSKCSARTTEELRQGASLPGLDFACGGARHAFEYAEGRDPEVFKAWLGTATEGGRAQPEQQCNIVSSDSTNSFDDFFAHFGDSNAFLSTEGMRPY